MEKRRKMTSSGRARAGTGTGRWAVVRQDKSDQSGTGRCWRHGWPGGSHSGSGQCKTHGSLGGARRTERWSPNVGHRWSQVIQSRARLVTRSARKKLCWVHHRRCKKKLHSRIVPSDVRPPASGLWRLCNVPQADATHISRRHSILLLQRQAVTPRLGLPQQQVQLVSRGREAIVRHCIQRHM